MGTNVATLLADLLFYSYESEFIQQIKRSGAKKQCHSILIARLAKQGFSFSRLHHSFKKVSDCHQDLIR